MAVEPSTQPSFSPRRRWAIGLDVVVRTVVVLVVVGMLNYLAGRYHQRLHLGAQSRTELHARTVTFLKSLTNEVKVTVYYDKDDPLYSSVAALLNEMRDVNPRLRVTVVDYLRDAAAAQKVKTDYKLGESTDEHDRNLVIFDSQKRTRVINGNALAEYTLEQVPTANDREFQRKRTAFKAEMAFTSALLAVTSPNPLKAYFLQGHGEHRPDSGDEIRGYLKFAGLLQLNYIQVEPLSLLGTNEVPADCSLLIIAGPTTPIADTELEKIEQYLQSEQGGRLFALFNSAAQDRRTGLEKLLVRWGVLVGESAIRDPVNSLKGADVAIASFSRHPVTNPLIGSMIDLIAPRPVGILGGSDRTADAPKVEGLAGSEETALLVNDPSAKPRSYPLAVAVEKRPVTGVVTQRGTTRMVVVGDSYFLGNAWIDILANRDFAESAVNWLLERHHMLDGVGPRPITEFRVILTQAQMQTTRWLLLAAMPGAVLLLGGLVWFRRRK